MAVAYAPPPDRACSAHNPRRSGPFGDRGSHFTTIRGDWRHLVGRQSVVGGPHRPARAGRLGAPVRSLRAGRRSPAAATGPRCPGPGGAATSRRRVGTTPRTGGDGSGARALVSTPRAARCPRQAAHRLRPHTAPTACTAVELRHRASSPTIPTIQRLGSALGCGPVRMGRPSRTRRPPRRPRPCPGHTPYCENNRCRITPDRQVSAALTYIIKSSQKIMLEGLSNHVRGQMVPKVVHSSPDLPHPGQTNWQVSAAVQGAAQDSAAHGSAVQGTCLGVSKEATLHPSPSAPPTRPCPPAIVQTRVQARGRPGAAWPSSSIRTEWLWLRDTGSGRHRDRRPPRRERIVAAKSVERVGGWVCGEGGKVGRKECVVCVCVSVSACACAWAWGWRAPVAYKEVVLLLLAWAHPSACTPRNPRRVVEPTCHGRPVRAPMHPARTAADPGHCLQPTTAAWLGRDRQPLMRTTCGDAFTLAGEGWQWKRQ